MFCKLLAYCLLVGFQLVECHVHIDLGLIFAEFKGVLKDMIKYLFVDLPVASKFTLLNFLLVDIKGQ